MKLAVHCANLTWPGGPEALGRTLAGVARAADEGGVTTLTMMDHWFQMEHARRPARADARGLHLARLPRRPDQPRRARPAGHRRHLPPPGAARQDRHHPRRALRRPGVARHRRRLVRARAPRPRRPVPAASPSASSGSRRRCRSAGRCGATTTARTTARTTSSPRRSACPRRCSAGGPPILIGGSGERKTLRLVAQYADACNLFGFEPDEMRHKIEVLDRHCADVGRDPAEIAADRDRRRGPARRRRRVPARARRRTPPSASSQVWVGPRAGRPGRQRDPDLRGDAPPPRAAGLTWSAYPTFRAARGHSLHWGGVATPRWCQGYPAGRVSLHPPPGVLGSSPWTTSCCDGSGRGPRTTPTRSPGPSSRRLVEEGDERRARRPVRRHPGVRHGRAARGARRRPQPDEPRRRAARGGRPRGVPPGAGPRRRLASSSATTPATTPTSSPATPPR